MSSISRLSRRALLAGAAPALIALGPLSRAALAMPLDAFPVSHSDADWRRLLPRAAYGILRRGGTERAFSSPLDREHRPGTFSCAGCSQASFSSKAKFDSGTGWPSFFEPLPGAVATQSDTSLGMARTEVHCTRCGGHLGHVFNDGPQPTGLRYCMNGAALRFSAAT